MIDWKRLSTEHEADKKRYYIIVSGDKEFKKDEFFIATFGDTVEPVLAQDILNAVLLKLLSNVYDKYEELKFVIGDNRGSDSMAIEWALDHDHDVRQYEADWEEDGKAAGFKRNECMFSYVGMKPHKASILFWDGINPMTRNLIWLAHQYSVPVRVYNYKTRKILNAEEIKTIQWEESTKQREYGRA